MTTAKIRIWHSEKINDDYLKSYLDSILAYQKEQFAWYEDKKGKKRSFSTWLLNAALLTFCLSLILPLAPGLLNLDFKATSTFYAAGYIALIITTITLLGDRLFGHSNGWIRYTIAYLQIDRVTSEFYNKWLLLLPKLEGGNIPEEIRVAAFELLEKFDSALKNIVKDETNNWRNLFTGQLAEFSKKADSRLESVGQEITKFKESTENQLVKFKHVHLNLEVQKIPEKSIVDLKLTLNSHRALTKKLFSNANTWGIEDVPVGIYLMEYDIKLESGTSRVYEEFLNISGDTPIKNIKKSLDTILDC